MKSLPLFCITVFDAHEIDYSGLCWNVRDVGLPELIRPSRLEQVPGLCSSPVEMHIQRLDLPQDKGSGRLQQKGQHTDTGEYGQY